ncbi:DHHC palmitoyltransferase-domain-containing protein [Roridomyces roridus]|uniref:Palmitoyltransferase n=1 Tax=Roridomyces roridus TaxID=1738132 RepID=A0AAD7BKM3_9AGAR|nr:DHHC palmitoyltransferase-domain-containing protein [Roridomyces roridus]
MTSRANLIIELCIQIFILSLIGYTLYLTTIEIAIKWLINYRSQRLIGGAYLATLLFLIPLLGTVYVSLTLGRRTHNVPRYPLPDTDDLTEPYECINSSGDLATCAKCNGAWKPPRTHHCSTCGVCRMEFDHHCPWVGNCVTKSRLKPFLALLILTPVVFLVSILPVYGPLLRNIALALKVSQSDPWAQRVWWDWYGSWIFVGGPPGRFAFGIVLGFWILRAERKPDVPLMEQPNLRLFVICALVLLFSLFTLALAAWITKDLVRGVTTLDGIKGRRENQPLRFACIPGARIVAAVPNDERLYDLGFRSNIESVFCTPQPTSRTYVWPKINPSVLERLRKTSESNSITTS